MSLRGWDRLVSRDLGADFEANEDPFEMGPFVGEYCTDITDNSIAVYLLDLDCHPLDEFVSRG